MQLKRNAKLPTVIGLTIKHAVCCKTLNVIKQFSLIYTLSRHKILVQKAPGAKVLNLDIKSKYQRKNLDFFCKVYDTDSLV